MKKNSRKTNTESESVRRLICDAFPDIIDRIDLSPMTHNECIGMRTGIMTLRPEFVPYYLRQLLTDLLDTHEEHSSRDTIDFIRVLDVLMEDANYVEQEKIWGKVNAEQSRNRDGCVRLAKKELFSSVTAEQAHVLCIWLDLTKTWDDLKLYGAEIKAARHYWEKRAAGGY